MGASQTTHIEGQTYEQSEGVPPVVHTAKGGAGSRCAGPTLSDATDAFPAHVGGSGLRLVGEG